MENGATGETKVLKDCLFRLMPLYMTQMIKAGQAPASAIDQVRTELFHGLGAIAQGVHRQIKHDG